MTDATVPPHAVRRIPAGTEGEFAKREFAKPVVPPWLIIGATALAAVVLGGLLADHHLTYGVGVVVVVCYGTLVVFDLQRALAVWVAVLFFEGLKALSHGPNTVGVLLALGWLGAFIGGRVHPLGILRAHRRLLLSVVIFALWLTLTIAWSSRPSASFSETGYWWEGVLAFVIVLTSVRTPLHVRYIAIAFLTGAVISVFIGAATGGLNASAASDSITATTVNGRLTGGGTDPNVQAAGYIAAMFFSLGLLSVYRSRRARFWLIAAFLIVTVGFFAAQSRGGLVALVVATIAALILAPGQRRRMAGLAVVVLMACAILVATNPGALKRIVDVGGGTSGRGDLWRVAAQVFEGHPLIGVGVGNFEVVEGLPRYVLRPGSISRIQYLAEAPQVAHNTYLQLLAESGVVGLLAFLVVIGGVVKCYLAACRRFEALGRADYADLARASLMALIGFLTAIFFITDGWDERLWVIMAIGPVMLGIAMRMSSSAGAARALQAAS